MSIVQETNPAFIVDNNVARLAHWLRMLGYDTLVFDQPDDWQIVRIALTEKRIIITRDTGVMKRRVITSGKLNALFITADDPEAQIKQVIAAFSLDAQQSFTRCLECNASLASISADVVKERIPRHVLETQTQFMECPKCHRVYWRGTHWQEMLKTLDRLTGARKE
jgi:uncharacterized protein with PIN domain